jgi:hypothetical protein
VGLLENGAGGGRSTLEQALSHSSPSRRISSCSSVASGGTECLVLWVELEAQSSSFYICTSTNINKSSVIGADKSLLQHLSSGR